MTPNLPRLVGFWCPSDAELRPESLVVVLRSACRAVEARDEGAVCRADDTTVAFVFDPEGDDILWVESAVGPDIGTLLEAVEEALVIAYAALPIASAVADKKFAWTVAHAFPGGRSDDALCAARRVVKRLALVDLSLANQDFETAADARADAWSAADELAGYLRRDSTPR